MSIHKSRGSNTHLTYPSPEFWNRCVYSGGMVSLALYETEYCRVEVNCNITSWKEGGRDCYFVHLTTREGAAFEKEWTSPAASFPSRGHAMKHFAELVQSLNKTYLGTGA